MSDPAAPATTRTLFDLPRWEMEGDGFFADVIWLNDAIEVQQATEARLAEAERLIRDLYDLSTQKAAMARVIPFLAGSRSAS